MFASLMYGVGLYTTSRYIIGILEYYYEDEEEEEE